MQRLRNVTLRPHTAPHTRACQPQRATTNPNAEVSCTPPLDGRFSSAWDVVKIGRVLAIQFRLPKPNATKADRRAHLAQHISQRKIHIARVL